MHRIFRRSILWLLPAVILPLGALFVLQYRFLRTLEQKTVSAERNWLRNSLEKVTHDIERRYRTAAENALTVTPATLAEPAAFGAHVAKHRVPGARTFFATRFSPDMMDVRWFAPTGAEKAVPHGAEASAVKMASISWHAAHRWGRIVHDLELDVEERDPKNRVILRPIVDESMHVVGVAGVVLDPQLAKTAMISIGNAALARPGVAVRVGDRFPRQTGSGREFVTQPLGFVFTDWRAGVRDLCASPEEIAAANFRINMIWTGSVMLVLAAAIALGIQAVLRQARLSQMKSDFVSNVSHELRTPLSSIRVFGEYMRLGRVTKPEKIQQYGEYIEAESRRLTSLINNILDFSKIESAEKKYRFCEVDLEELLEQTVEALEMPLRDRGFTITFESRTHPPRLRIDKDALGPVFANLIDNAVKYSGERKQIDVWLEQTGDEVRVSVRDHGIGIAPVEQKKIFEKFYRVGSHLVHDVKGSGLGLAIVRHVVQAHGGRVDLRSAPGEGSTFTIVLPLPRGAEARVPATEYA
jgi:signal transduction histidine kinase